MANDDVIERARRLVESTYVYSFPDGADTIIEELCDELRASRARVAELGQLATRMSILGHSAFQGGWSRVDETMREFDRLYDAAMAG